MAAEKREPESEPQRQPRRPRDDEGSGKVGAQEGKREISCDLCGSPMFERHCKLLCPRCGYQRDCSDP